MHGEDQVARSALAADSLLLTCWWRCRAVRIPRGPQVCAAAGPGAQQHGAEGRRRALHARVSRRCGMLGGCGKRRKASDAFFTPGSVVLWGFCAARARHKAWGVRLRSARTAPRVCGRARRHGAPACVLLPRAQVQGPAHPRPGLPGGLRSAQRDGQSRPAGSGVLHWTASPPGFPVAGSKRRAPRHTARRRRATR